MNASSSCTFSLKTMVIFRPSTFKAPGAGFERTYTGAAHRGHPRRDGLCWHRPSESSLPREWEGRTVIYGLLYRESYIDRRRRVLSNSRLMGLSFLIAFEKGTYTISSFFIPIITLRWSSSRASMAAHPCAKPECDRGQWENRRAAGVRVSTHTHIVAGGIRSSHAELCPWHRR